MTYYLIDVNLANDNSIGQVSKFVSYVSYKKPNLFKLLYGGKYTEELKKGGAHKFLKHIVELKKNKRVTKFTNEQISEKTLICEDFISSREHDDPHIYALISLVTPQKAVVVSNDNGIKDYYKKNTTKRKQIGYLDFFYKSDEKNFVDFIAKYK